jgi:hypothetical protein
VVWLYNINGAGLVIPRQNSFREVSAPPSTYKYQYGSKIELYKYQYGSNVFQSLQNVAYLQQNKYILHKMVFL